jgi:hypothetical protein
VAGREPVVLMEMTLRNLTSPSGIDHADFLARADILGALGLKLLISRFEQYYHVSDYLAAYTDRMIGIAVGMPSLREIAQDKYYTEPVGRLLEAVGRLFKRSVKMYVYPTQDPVTGQIITVTSAGTPPLWRHLAIFCSRAASSRPSRTSTRAVCRSIRLRCWRASRGAIRCGKRWSRRRWPRRSRPSASSATRRPARSLS